MSVKHHLIPFILALALTAITGCDSNSVAVSSNIDVPESSDSEVEVGANDSEAAAGAGDSEEAAGAGDSEEVVGAGDSGEVVSVGDSEEVVGAGDTEEVDANDSENDSPNILLIITDDQGLDASAQFNLSADLPNTPVIDRLAANGITYENAWATPSCTTTRAAILTGKHGVNNGVTFTPGTLSSNVGTIHQYLQDTAPEYRTGVFGKWHVGGANPDRNHPADLGVQHYAGNLIGNLPDYSDWLITVNGEQSQSSVYHTSAVVDNALGWINEQEQPWFAWLAFAAPHSPFHLPPEGFNARGLSGTEADINSNTRDYYLAAIETLDTELGRLLDSMDREERENTLIIVIGDNGTPAPVVDRSVYTGNHSKGSLFEGGVHVPLVISGKGVSRTNEREAGLVNIVDLFPTIAAVTGQNVAALHDGYSLLPSLSSANAIERSFSYTEFSSDNPLGTGWTVRSDRYKYIAFADGTENLFDLSTDLNETNNLFPLDNSLQVVADELQAFGLAVRNESLSTTDALDISNSTLINNSPSCADHASSYLANVSDASTGIAYEASLTITESDTHCVLNTNATPNHNFNDGGSAFPNAFSQQNDEYRVSLSPSFASQSTALSLRYDDAILLNGVKVDLLAAGCFGVGNGMTGCNDDSQPWRFDPMFAQNGFRVDTHNAHTQPDGAYHYHGDPLALFDRSGAVESPVVGFAADGFPIYGSFINNNGSIQEVASSFQLKAGERPSGAGSPGGPYDGSYRDDYEYVAGSGDLDECNGSTINGQYAYFITQAFPYVMSCFKGSVDESFRK